jgi:hypothetical protein
LQLFGDRGTIFHAHLGGLEMRKHQEQIRFALVVVRELAARDGRSLLVRLAEEALLENEVGDTNSMAQRQADSDRMH